MPGLTNGEENNDNSQNQNITEGSENEDNSKGEAPKTFSQDDVDKIVSKRVNEINARNEKVIDQKIQEARAEWERQQHLSDEERAEDERRKASEALENRERELALRENRADAREILQDKGLPTSMIDFLVVADADKTKDNIDAFEKAWRDALEKEVSKKVAGVTPTDKSRSNNSGNEKTSTRDLLYNK